MKTNYTNLDLLRSFAVLSVVVQHLWHQCVNFHLCAYDPAVNKGLHNISFTGVMFFFVHTSLVLMLSIDRTPAWHRTRNFLIRRAFRIYPLCWATILLALASGLTDQTGGTLQALGWRGVVANLLLAQNMLRSIPSVVGPLWSLPWEVQMYMVLPIFFICLRRFDRPGAAFAIWFAFTFAMAEATQPALPRMFHGAIFPPMFISGMVTYCLMIRRQHKPDRGTLPAWIWPFFVLTLFVLQDLLLGERSTESPIGSIIDACICLMLAVAIPFFRELMTGWIAFPAHQIARYSYGIYLLHVPAMIFVMRFLPHLPLPMKVVAFVIITGLLSVVSFHVIENPLIQPGKRLTQTVDRSSTHTVPALAELTAESDSDWTTSSRSSRRRRSLLGEKANETLSRIGAVE